MSFENLSPSMKMAVLFPEVALKRSAYYVPFVKSSNEKNTRFFNIKLLSLIQPGLNVFVTESRPAVSNRIPEFSDTLYLPDYEEGWGAEQIFQRIMEELDLTCRFELAKKAEEFDLESIEPFDEIFVESELVDLYTRNVDIIGTMLKVTQTTLVTFLVKTEEYGDPFVKGYVYDMCKVDRVSDFLNSSRPEKEAFEIYEWAKLVAKAGLLHLKIPVSYRKSRDLTSHFDPAMVAGQLKKFKPDLFNRFYNQLVMEKL